MANFDSAPPKSNHKTNCKEPGAHTQLWAEIFEVQTALNYTENLIIYLASAGLTPPANPSPPVIGVLKGTCFTFEISEGPTGDSNRVVFQWRSPDIVDVYP